MSEDQLQGHSPSVTIPITDTLLLVGCSDGHLRFWDWRTATLVKVVRAHKGDVVDLVNAQPLDSSGPREVGALQPVRFVSLGADHTVLLWNLQCTGNLVVGEAPTARLGTLGGVPLSVDFNREEDAVTPCTSSGEVHVWELGSLPASTDYTGQLMMVGLCRGLVAAGLKRSTS